MDLRSGAGPNRAKESVGSKQHKYTVLSCQIIGQEEDSKRSCIQNVQVTSKTCFADD
uniref:Uncharacterized protein n=1 Tax=Arundo donax TaxID=35708 RepID=A0A0A9FMP2_ARUDO